MTELELESRSTVSWDSIVPITAYYSYADKLDQNTIAV